MRRRRTGRLVRVRYEQKLIAIGFGVAGTSTVAIGVAVGGQGIDDPVYTTLVGSLFPLAMFVLARRGLRREVPKANALADHHQVEAASRTRRREILAMGMIWPIFTLVLLEIGEMLFFGLFWITPMTAVAIYLIRWVDDWEHRSGAILYRERGLLHWERRYVRDSASVEVKTPSAVRPRRRRPRAPRASHRDPR